MLKKFNKFFRGVAPVERNHDFFGKILFMGGDTPKDDDYWEAELRVSEAKEPISVLINAGLEGPSVNHVEFYKRCVSDLDSLFEKCWPVFEPDFEQWAGKTLGGDWSEDFDLMSIEIPRDGNERNEWTVGYYVDLANHYFAARFVDGEAKHNEIDG